MRITALLATTVGIKVKQDLCKDDPVDFFWDGAYSESV